jgi:hypothetical protein
MTYLNKSFLSNSEELINGYYEIQSEVSSWREEGNGRWTPKTGQGAKLYVRVLKGGTDNGKNQKKAQSAI